VRRRCGSQAWLPNAPAHRSARSRCPRSRPKAWRIHTTIQQFEAHQAFAWEYRANYDAMPPLLRGRLDESEHFTPADYEEARAIAVRARAALAETFEEVDVFLTFSAPGAAPKGIDWTGDPVLTGCGR